MKVRTAVDQDAAGMSRMLERLVAAGRRTARADVGIMREAYISSSMWCSLTADDNGKPLGFQSLIYALMEIHTTPAGRLGIIGTHVNPDAARSWCRADALSGHRAAAIEAGALEY